MNQITNNEQTKRDVRIVDQAFAARLELACANHPVAPTAHGRQKWLREQLAAAPFNMELSPEAVRKWFSGESRPRPKVMSAIAQVLEVDEAWLSLNISPTQTVAEAKQHKASVGGAVNYVAGILQLNGASIAFPQKATDEFDFYAIVGDRHMTYLVKAPRVADDEMHFSLPVDYESSVVIGVLPGKRGVSFDLVRLTNQLIRKAGVTRGGYTEVTLSSTSDGYELAGTKVTPIRSYGQLVAE